MYSNKFLPLVLCSTAFANLPPVLILHDRDLKAKNVDRDFMYTLQKCVHKIMPYDWNCHFQS